MKICLILSAYLHLLKCSTGSAVAQTKSDIDELRNLSGSVDGRIEKSERARFDLRDKLARLKQSIREAREEANKVQHHTSMYIEPVSGCICCINNPEWQFPIINIDQNRIFSKITFLSCIIVSTFYV